MGFGAAHLGELYRRVPEAESQATLAAAWEHGIRYYDTAPWYGRGLAEHRLGGFLRTLPRDQFQVSTKVGRTLHRPADPARFDRSPWTGGLNFEVRFDYSYDGVMRSYEQALQRLALDTVDALVIHDLEAMFHGERTADYRRQLTDGGGIRALQELKAAGQIAAYGMGVNTDDALDTVAAGLDLDFLLVAMPYTLLDQRSLHHGMARCVARGMGVIIGAPYASGILVTGSGAGATYAYGAAPPEVQAKVQGIERVAAAHGVTLASAALQFVLAHPAVASVIPGAARPSEVAGNLAALRATIPAGFWSDLKAQGLILPDAPVPDGPVA
jgi:D-threo-aldose 1-dehydrogenase